MIKLLLIATMLFSFSAFAQSIQETLSRCDVNQITAEHIKSIRDGDTLYFVYLSFRNDEYTHIHDPAKIYIWDESDFEQFVADLDSALAKFEVKLKERVGKTFSWDEDAYKIRMYDFALFKVYLYEGGTTKYTTLNKKQLKKLITWLKTIDLK